MKRRMPKLLGVLTMIFIMSCILNISAIGSENVEIVFDEVNTFPGEEVTVNATLNGNPGIMSAALKIEYSDSLLLLDSENGPAFTEMLMTRTDLASGSKFVWESKSDAIMEDGVILSLTFRVSETAPISGDLLVSASYVDGEIIDSYLNPIDVVIKPAKVSVFDYLPGDLNNDSKINTSDVILMRKHITGETGLVINEAAADFDGNGKRNVTDLLLLRRYIAGGYGVVPQYPKDNPSQQKYNITYHLYDGDTYLQTLDIDNTNPDSYVSGQAVNLYDLYVDGYRFEGWYAGQSSSAPRVTTIAANQSGNLDLYARWVAKEYVVQFESPLYPVNSIKYTTDKGTTLGANPTLSGYVFTGWTDENNNIVTRIEKGTVGNIILYANWASKRNQARPISALSDPVILYDEELNCIQFAYEIGTIENVPLYEIEYLGNKADGITFTKTTTSSGTVTNSTANTVANIVSNATTASSTWSLSKDWNVTVIDSSSHTSESESSSTDESESGDGGETESESNGSSGGTDTSSWGASANAKIGVGSPALGTYAEVGGEAHGEEESERTWNTEDGYKTTNKTTSNLKHIDKLNNKIINSSSHSFSKSDGGSETTSTSTATTHSNTSECASSFTFSTQETQTSAIQYSNENAPEGYYRVVCAGTLVVYAVVNYDIATKSYGVFTYSLLEDETKDFLDYSKVSSNFDDNMNGTLPFEVPIFVNNYVDSVVGGAEKNGFVVDPETGTVVDYTGDNTDVIIPEYITVDTENDSADVIKVTGISSSAFAGKNISSIELCGNIKTIPDDAFKNCSALQTVKALGVNIIGNNAFDGCVSLDNYVIQESVESVGINAFRGAGKIRAIAGNANVAKATAESGAVSIYVDISNLSAELDNVRIDVPDITNTIEIYGGGNTYSNLRIVSGASETVINRVNITSAEAPALKLSSEKVTFNRVTINSSTWALMFGADTTEVSLYGTTQLSTTNEDAILCKNISLKRLNANVIGKINVTGNLLICGTIENDSLITYTSKSNINVERFNVLWNNSWSDWSDWSDTAVEANSDREVETKVQYRYADKLTTSSTSSSLSGWTQTGSSTSYGSWGGWSPWQTSGIAGSDTREVQTATVYPYYYFYCTHCGLGARYPYWGSSRRCEICGLTGYIINETGTVDWFTSPWSNSVQWGSDTAKRYQILFDHRIGNAIYWNWTDGGPTTGYSYRDRSKTVTYSYERWGNWSDWSETVYSSSSTRKVETRTLYRSRIRQ